MDIDAVKSLEENCMYRFGSNADALAAALVYASALGISKREARELAGLPVRSRLVESWTMRRGLALLGFAAAAFALAWFARPELSPTEAAAPARVVTRPAVAPLPPPWEIEVDVYNGTRLGNAAAGVANEVAGLAYRIGAVGDARTRTYLRTLVYYPPGAEEIAKRLAGDLGVGTQALPGGDNPRKLVVIVGKTR
jgi:hypothetical protein